MKKILGMPGIFFVCRVCFSADFSLPPLVSAPGA
jgi:hypothetical protein